MVQADTHASPGSAYAATHDDDPAPSTSRSESSVSHQQYRPPKSVEMQGTLSPLSPVHTLQPPAEPAGADGAADTNASHAHSSNELTPHRVEVRSQYDGSGTEADPYVIKFVDNDPENPMNYSDRRKLIITFVTSISTLVVSFDSSAYSGAVNELRQQFAPVTDEIITLGISLYVLGFALGPLCWGPLSEVYGRRRIFYASYIPYICFLAAACGSPNITALIIFRLLQGTFGSSPITNSGGTISDMYAANERGNALSVYSISVFCGPILGPIIGGFVSTYAGWRWTFAVMALFPAGVFVFNAWLVPETYHPELLKRRADKLMKEQPGVIYRTQQQIADNSALWDKLKMALTRPWRLLLLEPIVTCLATWIAIIYGTLYLCFEAFPIIFQQQRGWSPGIGGLAFLGVGAGMVLGVASNVFYWNPRYLRTAHAAQAKGNKTPPEARLPMAIFGGCILPISLFCFAWTSYPWIHWSAPIILASPFGAGMVLIFLAANSYLIDVFQRWAASALAANTLLRSLFGFAFPLFATDMYVGLGVQWATTLVACLTLICVPIPFVFYLRGSYIRSFSKHAPTGRNLTAAKSSSNLEQPERQRSLSAHDQKLANIQEADHDEVPHDHAHPRLHPDWLHHV